jgi:hypothetical protein
VEEKLKRMPHPAYNPDRSSCDSFLFGYLKDKSIDTQYVTPEKLFSEVETIISEIPCDLISRVFATWQERLQISPHDGHIPADLQAFWRDGNVHPYSGSAQ